MNKILTIVIDDFVYGKILTTALQGAGQFVDTLQLQKSNLQDQDDLKNRIANYDFIVLEANSGQKLALDFIKMVANIGSPKIVAYADLILNEELKTFQELGVVDFLIKPLDLNNLITTLATNNHSECEEELLSKLVFNSPCSANLLNSAKNAASENTPVMISGELGVGKKTLAKLIHAYSPLSANESIFINARKADAFFDRLDLESNFNQPASIPHGIGTISPPAVNTVVLMDIAELSPSNQERLLISINSQLFNGLPVQRYRLITTCECAKDLKRKVESGKFNQGLYFLLTTTKLDLSPLHDRPEDLMSISETVIENLNQQFDKNFLLSPKLKQFLINHCWTGNILELKTLLHNLYFHDDPEDYVMQEFEMHSPAVSPTTETHHTHPAAEATHLPEVLSDAVKHNEFDLILDSLKRHAGNRSNTSTELGIKPRTLRNKLARMREEGYKIPEVQTSSKQRRVTHEVMN